MDAAVNANRYETLADFPMTATDKLRYSDTDRQGHVNNAAFATFLETGRVEIIHREALGDEGASFVSARLELDFLAEVTWPGEVHSGTAVQEVGRSSFKLHQMIFQNGKPVARAVSVLVQMNNESRRSQPFAADTRARLQKLISPAAGS